MWNQLWLLLPALADLSLQGKGMEEAVAFQPSDSDNICEPEAPPVAAAVPGSAQSQPYVRKSLYRDFLSHEAKSHVGVTSVSCSPIPS